MIEIYRDNETKTWFKVPHIKNMLVYDFVLLIARELEDILKNGTFYCSFKILEINGKKIRNPPVYCFQYFFVRYNPAYTKVSMTISDSQPKDLLDNQIILYRKGRWILGNEEPVIQNAELAY
jgi:hypothetical protein